MDQNNNIQKAKPVPPFVRYCSAIIPTMFDDSLSYYEALCALWKWMQDNLVNVINNNANVTEYYIQIVKDLKSYVENYFKDLDVQEEINNKLDQMAEDGQLADIISQYLNSTAIFGYDSVADMKSADNLVSGSYARTLGYYAPNDGGGALYKISDQYEADDQYEQIGTLYAILIADDYVNVKQFGAKGDDSTDDTLNFQKAIDYVASKNLKLIVNAGTFRVSHLLAQSNVRIEGEDKIKSVIKSIDSNTYDSIIELLNHGINNTDIGNLTVNGNKENNSRSIIGIYLHNDPNGDRSDRYSNIHDLVVRNCTGSGIKTYGEISSSDIRECRFYNLRLMENNGYGLELNSCTDSLFNTITSANNLKAGFYLTGGPHKFINCKAHTNGIGDGTTIENVKRIPSSAFSVTSDAAPIAGKNYYTRTGNNVNGDWYIFDFFEGETFDPDTTYYEITTTYYKRYAGFEIQNAGSFTFSNCEAQDNYGDGFNVYRCNDSQFTNIVCDNNGFLGASTSYTGAGLEQLYYGFYIEKSGQLKVDAVARNFRAASVGKDQKALFFLYGVGRITGNCLSDNQYSEDYIFVQSSDPAVDYFNNIDIDLNNKPYRYELPISSLSVVEENCNIQEGNDGYKCFLFKQDKMVYMKLIFRKTGGIMTDTSAHTLIRLPWAFRPIQAIMETAYVSSDAGWNTDGTCAVNVSDSGILKVQSRSAITVRDVVVNLVYPAKN